MANGFVLFCMKVVLAEAGVNCHPALSFYLVCCLMSRGSVLRLVVADSISLALLFCKKQSALIPSLLKVNCPKGKRGRPGVPLRKKSRSARLFGCKRPHNGSAVATNFLRYRTDRICGLFSWRFSDGRDLKGGKEKATVLLFPAPGFASQAAACSAEHK